MASAEQLWTDEEKDDARELAWPEFQRRYPGRSYRAWQTMRYRQRLLQAGPSPEPATFRYVNRKAEPTPDDWQTYFASLERTNELAGRLRREQPELTVRFEGPLPIGLAFTGDWHAGSRGTDYARLRADLDRLARADAVYAVGMGDYKHNLKHSQKQGAGLYAGAFNSPEEQAEYVKQRLEVLRGRWLALVQGNHDFWDYKTSGLNGHAALGDWLECGNLGHGGVLHVEIGRERYALGVRHKYGGNSANNTTNGQRRFFDEYPAAENLDAVVLGHLHYNDLQKCARRGHKTVWLRSGSYLVADEHGDEIGGYVGEPGVPLLIGLPDQHRLIPFEGSDLAEGLLLLQALRHNYQEAQRS